MTAQMYEFSQKDQKIRKRWLITLPFMVVLELITLCIHLSDKQGGWNTIALVAAILIALYSLLYFFAHQKHGMRFLMFYLLYPIIRIKDFSSFADIFKVTDVYEAIGLILFLGPYGWWYYISFRLIDINNKVKAWKKQLKKQLADAGKNSTPA